MVNQRKTMPMRPELAAIIDPNLKALVDDHNTEKLPCMEAFPDNVVLQIKRVAAPTVITPQMVSDLVGPEILAVKQGMNPNSVVFQPHPGFPDLEMQVAGIKGIGTIVNAWLDRHRNPSGANADMVMGTVYGIILQMKFGYLMPASLRMTFPEPNEQRSARLKVITKILEKWDEKNGLPKNQVEGSRNALQYGLPQVLTAHPFCY